MRKVWRHLLAAVVLLGSLLWVTIALAREPDSPGAEAEPPRAPVRGVRRSSVLTTTERALDTSFDASGDALVAQLAPAGSGLAGTLVLFGGETARDVPFDDMWSFDGLDWGDVVPQGLTPSPRGRHGMVFDSRRCRLVLFGGVRKSDSGIEEHLVDTWEYAENGWTQIQIAPPTCPSGIQKFVMAYDTQRGVTVLFVLQALDGAHLNDT